MRAPAPSAVVAVCLLVVVFDGYDLIVYGASVPDLLHEPGWGLNASRVGGIASWTLFGMLLGALGAGLLVDRWGPRRLILTGVSWFSVAMVACAAAPGPDALRVLRFLAGLGLGGVIPSAIALTMAFAPTQRRQLYNALMFAGYPVGGVPAAALARWLLADHGWRLLFGLGAAPFVVVLPVAWRFLPASRPATTPRPAPIGTGPRALFRRDLAVGCAGFGSVGTQILVNGYLAAHYPAGIRGSALGWSLGVGRAGAILGPTLGGWLLDAGFGFRSNFYTFAGVAAVGLLAVAAVPPRRAETPSEARAVGGVAVREELHT